MIHELAAELAENMSRLVPRKRPIGGASDTAGHTSRTQRLPKGREQAG